MYQNCFIAVAAKKALKRKSALSNTTFKYVNKIEFQFLPEKQFFNTKTYKAENIPAWYHHCCKKKLKDLKLIAPVTVKDRNVLGFSNTTQSSILCFYKKGKVSYFPAQWEFDPTQKMWNVLYTEHELKNTSFEKPCYDNNIDSFISVLSQIKEFAHRIDCEEFALKFQKALDILLDPPDYTDTAYQISLPDIPEENLYLLEAASTADVFGTMGSWDDSPSQIAHKKGMTDEYEFLSGELFKQVRLAILYAVNEW